jgi:hypothetical protein
MALSNAERQARWRERRNALALSPTDSDREIAHKIVRAVGIARAREFAKALPRLLAPMWMRKRAMALRRKH